MGKTIFLSPTNIQYNIHDLQLTTAIIMSKEESLYLVHHLLHCLQAVHTHISSTILFGYVFSHEILIFKPCQLNNTALITLIMF